MVGRGVLPTRRFLPKLKSAYGQLTPEQLRETIMAKRPAPCSAFNRFRESGRTRRTAAAHEVRNALARLTGPRWGHDGCSRRSANLSLITPVSRKLINANCPIMNRTTVTNNRP